MEKPSKKDNLRVEIHTSKRRSPIGYGGGNSANAKNSSNQKRSRRRKQNFNICTWNIQGLARKKKEVIREIERLKVDIVVLTETKRKGQGQERLGNYIHIWSGVKKSERARAGVSVLIRNKWTHRIQNWQEINERILEITVNINGQMITIIAVYGINDDSKAEEKYEFFETVSEILEKANKAHEIIVIGDLNCRVGKEENDEVIGKYGENTRNDNGKRLIQLCREHKYKVTNTYFAHKDVHKYTWEQRTRSLKSIIDLILMKQQHKIVIRDVRVYRKPECGTDHYLLMGKFRCNGYNKQETVEIDNRELQEIREYDYNIELLQQQEIRTTYQTRLDEELDLITERTTVEMCEHITNSIHTVATETLGVKEKGSKKDKIPISRELEQLIEEKKRTYEKYLSDKQAETREEYRKIKQRVKKKYKDESNEFWENTCTYIDKNLGYNKSREAWKTIKTCRTNTKQTSHISMITPTQWIDHYEQLLQERRNGYIQQENSIPINHIQSDITVKDVEEALRQTKNNRAAGPGGIKPELLKYGGKKLNLILTKLFQLIEMGGKVPLDWNISMISSIYKKGNRKEPSNYRGISVIPSISRVYGRIIKNKIETKMKDINEAQNGFRSGRSCLDNLFCVRQIIEKRKEKNLETYMIFIDFEKAYDNVPRNKVWQAMRRLDIDEKWIEIVKQLYSNTSGKIKVGNLTTQNIEITKGLKQGCTLSPLLFNIYLDQILEQWSQKNVHKGIPIYDEILNYLLFADDMIIFAENKEDLIEMIRELKEECDRWGLKINFNKTEYMCIGEENTNINLEEVEIQSTDKFKYLGAIISKSGVITEDVENRIRAGKAATRALHGAIWSKKLRKKTKRRIFTSIVESITLYGGETWPITEGIRDRIRTVELDYMRRSLQITRQDRWTTDRIWREMDIKSSITRNLENRTLRWYGHVKRMNEERWPKKILEWTPPGKRRRGRPTKKWTTYVQRIMEERELEDEDWNDRLLWTLRTTNL